MSISIKSQNDIEMMKIAGKKAASVLEMLDHYVKPGVSTEYLDQIAFKYITEDLNAFRQMLVITDFQRHCALQ